MYKSTIFLTLTLSQYDKAFVLSATPVPYEPLVLILSFLEPKIAEHSLYVSISKTGLSPNLYHLLNYSKWSSCWIRLTSPNVNDWT